MTKSELITRLAEQNPHLYQRDVDTLLPHILAELTFPLPVAPSPVRFFPYVLHLPSHIARVWSGMRSLVLIWLLCGPTARVLTCRQLMYVRY